MSEIQHVEEGGEGGGFVIDESGERIAEMTYRRGSKDHVTVNHTWVSPKLRGRGVARKLLDALVAWARQSKTQVSATCVYAKAEFEKDSSLRDVYQAR